MTEVEKTVGAPSGAQSDATASGQLPAVEMEVEKMPEEEAWKAFPKQVQAAIDYAGSNTYDYGPRLRRMELEYEVISARAMNDEITRVVLSYRPKGKFKGVSGSEYLDVDMNGDVQARRQIRVPKEAMPWVLVSLAVISVLAAAALIPLMLTTGNPSDPLYVAGRTLYVRSGEPRVMPYLYYIADDTQSVERTWIIVPEGEGTDIAYINVTLINPASAAVNLAIDADAMDITTEEGIVVHPIDVLKRVEWPAEGATVNPRYEVLDVPMWGDRVLEGQQQLQGFMAFEVPKGSKIKSMRWAATDVVTIRY